MVGSRKQKQEGRFGVCLKPRVVAGRAANSRAEHFVTMRFSCFGLGGLGRHANPLESHLKIPATDSGKTRTIRSTHQGKPLGRLAHCFDVRRG